MFLSPWDRLLLSLLKRRKNIPLYNNVTEGQVGICYKETFGFNVLHNFQRGMKLDERINFSYLLATQLLTLPKKKNCLWPFLISSPICHQGRQYLKIICYLPLTGDSTESRGLPHNILTKMSNSFLLERMFIKMALSWC